MTARELLLQLIPLAFDDPDAIVTIGRGCGPVGAITPTVNGFIILDPVRAEPL